MNTRTLASAVLVTAFVLVLAGTFAFTTAESQRTAEVYSDDDAGTLVGFGVEDRDETACSMTLEVTNRVPVPGKTVSLDTVEVTGDGFDAWTTSVQRGSLGVGESAEVDVRVEDGYVGRGTVGFETRMSGENVVIEMREQTWVYCEETDDTETNAEGGNPNGGEKGS